MLNKKTLIITITALLLVAPATADLKFKDPNNVTFYTGLEFNGNQQIYGLGKPTTSKSALRVTDVKDEYFNISGDTLEGDLDLNEHNINNFFNTGCGSNQAVKDVYNNGTFKCGAAGGGLPAVLRNNNTVNQNIDANNNQIENLSAPIDENDAVRLQDVSGEYVNITGDTLSGNMSFNNQYHITGLKDPVNSQDAATKNYVDNNDDAGTDDQDLSVGNDPSDGGSTTINITNGSSATFTDDYEANTDNQNINSFTSNDDTITIDLENGGSSSATIADNQTLSTTADGGTGTTDQITIDNGNTIEIDDDYAADDQSLSVNNDVSGTDDQITLDNGGSVTIDDDYEADTDAQSQCNNDQVLTGGGCVSKYDSGDDGDTNSNNEIQNPTVTTNDDEVTVSLDNGGSSDSASITDDNTQLDDEQPTSNVNMNNYKITNLAAPTNSNDAVRQTDLGNYLKQNGDTMNGNLDMNTNNITNPGCIGDQC